MGLIEGRLPLFPVSASYESTGGQERLFIGGCDVAALAGEFGTPLYVYDQASLDAAAAEYTRSLQAHYPGPARVIYAGKAFLCLAIAQWALARGCLLDCTGAGEIYLAGEAGATREEILVHGVSKSPADLVAGLQAAGRMVVDNLAELQAIIALRHQLTAGLPDLWLRLRPGVSVDTHNYTKTGQEDSKFGMSPDEIRQAARICIDSGLPLTGLHFHLGSFYRNPQPLATAIKAAINVAHELKQWYPKLAPMELSAGGGWGVAYHEDELPHPAIDSYIHFITQEVTTACTRVGMPLPTLYVEPGRSLVARAGVAIYTVNATKESGNRRWVLVDGGLADNPRPALYGARYSALPVCEASRAGAAPTWAGGPYCESSDVLLSDILLPEMRKGELLAVPGSGAYQLSMGSNYNGARRPAVIWVNQGEYFVIQRRESLAELAARDSRLPATLFSNDLESLEDRDPVIDS